MCPSLVCVPIASVPVARVCPPRSCRAMLVCVPNQVRARASVRPQSIPPCVSPSLVPSNVSVCPQPSTGPGECVSPKLSECVSPTPSRANVCPQSFTPPCVSPSLVPTPPCVSPSLVPSNVSVPPTKYRPGRVYVPKASGQSPKHRARASVSPEHLRGLVCVPKAFPSPRASVCPQSFPNVCPQSFTGPG